MDALKRGGLWSQIILRYDLNAEYSYTIKLHVRPILWGTGIG